MTVRQKSLRPANLQRIQNILGVLAEAKAKGKTPTRVEIFNILVDRKKEKDGILNLAKFGTLILDAIRLGHVGLKDIRQSKPTGKAWEPWENEIVLKNSNAEVMALLPHRKAKLITVQRYKLTKLAPARPAARSVKNTPMTAEERALLKALYPTTPNLELQRLHFPTRSVDTLISIARRAGLRKTKSIVPTMDPNKKIIEDILQRAHERGINAQRLDEILGAKGYFKWNWKNEHRRLHLEIIERASAFLGLRMRLEPIPEAHTFGHMVRQWKAIHCRVVDETPGKARLQKRAAPPRPSMNIGNHRPKDEVIELVEAAVPRQHPCREDVIHDVWESWAKGDFTIEDLKSPEGMRAIRSMANASRRQNFELGGFARSMDACIGEGTATLHDLIPAPELETEDEMEDA